MTLCKRSQILTIEVIDNLLVEGSFLLAAPGFGVNEENGCSDS
jgi:hypothetical protein